MTAPRTAPLAVRGTGTRSDDRALDEALDHIVSLSGRLLSLQRMHSAGRGLRQARCAGCGQAVPCPTLRLARGLP